VLLCLKLLSVHLSLAVAAGASSSVLGSYTRPLRKLLFKLLDTSVSEEIQEVCINKETDRQTDRQ